MIVVSEYPIEVESDLESDVASVVLTSIVLDWVVIDVITILLEVAMGDVVSWPFWLVEVLMDT